MTNNSFLTVTVMQILVRFWLRQMIPKWWRTLVYSRLLDNWIRLVQRQGSSTWYFSFYGFFTHFDARELWSKKILPHSYRYTLFSKELII